METVNAPYQNQPNQPAVYENVSMSTLPSGIEEYVYELPAAPAKPVSTEIRIDGFSAHSANSPATQVAAEAMAPLAAPVESQNAGINAFANQSGQQLNSRLAKGMDRIGRFFTKSAEVTERGSELAHRFGSFVGRTALRTAVEFKNLQSSIDYKREQWQNSGENRRIRTKNVLGRIASNIVTLKADRVSYDEHLASRPITIVENTRRSYERKEARQDFYDIFKPRQLAESSRRAAGVALKLGANIVSNVVDFHADNLSMKSSLKTIENRLIKEEGLDINGTPLTKNMSKKYFRNNYKADQLRRRAEYLKNRKNFEIPHTEVAA